MATQAQVLEKFAKAADLKFRVGETNALGKNIAFAKQQEFLQQMNQNNSKIRIEKSKLRSLLNLTTDFELEDSLIVPMPFSQIDSTLIAQNPQIKLAEKQIQIAEATRKVEKSALYPDLSAGYFIQSIAGNQELNGNVTNYDNSLRFQGFTVGVAVPLFAGSSVARAKAAKLTVESERQNSKYVRAQFKSRLFEEIEQLSTAKSLIEYYITIAEPNADQIISNSTKAYNNGDITYVEYLQGIETATEILRNSAEAVRSHNQTIINIRYLLNQ